MDVLTSPASSLPRLADHSGFLRRHRVWIAMLMILGGVAGLGWSTLQARSYSATASLALTSVPVYVMPTADELVPPEVSIDTSAQLLQSPRVLAAVATALGQRQRTVSDHLFVTASPNSQVLHVTVRATDATKAAAAANAAVDALIQVRRRSLGVLSDEQLRMLRFHADQQDRLLAREQSRRVVLPALDETFQDVRLLRTRLSELEATRRSPAQVVAAAAVPQTTDHANTEVPVASGIMLGLLAGCLFGLARDRTIRTTTEFEDRHVA